MSQLHFYVPDDIEKLVRLQAKRAQVPLSRFLAELVKREAAQRKQWPEGYFDHVFGRWAGEPLRREDEGQYEQRAKLE